MDAYLYSYLIGGLIFCVGLYYGFRNDYLGFGGRKLRNLILALSTIGFYAAIQGYLQYASMTEAAPVPYSGGADSLLDKSRQIRGTTLDYVVVCVYFAAIVLVGIWFGRKQNSVKDFFFGGQRFAWWLIGFSLIASTVGSYSFVKYGEMGYKYGLGATQSYWNDWIWFPLLAFGWLPILYFSRIISTPEYFGRRFGPKVRLAGTVYMLIYLIGYIGVNLYTMGEVLHILVGWNVLLSATIVAVLSLSYVVVGGQTSVIMTDLFQGLILLIAGLMIIALGAAYMGGYTTLWEHLPRVDRMAFPNYNEDADFPAIGIFWQDGVANSAMFLFLHQGMIMRFLAAKSLNDARKATWAMVVILLFVGAFVVASGGIVARAFTHAGILPEVKPKEAFFIASELLSHPGIFGLILAALTAALMSTVDTLITAVSAVVVNDLYRPYLRPQAKESQLLGAARIVAIVATLVGIVMVPIFQQFPTIYAAHAAFTAAVTPPLVVALLLAVFWRRFTKAGAMAVLIGGFSCILVSLFLPQIIEPFAQGVPMGEANEGIFGRVSQQMYMRALYGLVVCLGLGVIVSWFTKPESEEKQRGLVVGSISDALAHYVGARSREVEQTQALCFPRMAEQTPEGRGDMTGVRLSSRTARELQVRSGDLVYVTDPRWWTGGLYSIHAIVADIVDADDERFVEMEKDAYQLVVFKSRKNRPVRVERMYQVI